MQLNAVARPSIQVRCFGITDTVTQFATDKLMGNKGLGMLIVIFGVSDFLLRKEIHGYAGFDDQQA